MASNSHITEICPKCSLGHLERDDCALEEVIVCPECGSIFESGSIQSKYEFRTSVSYSDRTSARLNHAFQRSDSATSDRRWKKKSLEKFITNIADKMKLTQCQKDMCFDIVKEIVSQETVCSKWRPDEAIAASIIYTVATDKSMASRKRILACIKYSSKVLTKKIELVESLPSVKQFESNKPTETKEVRVKTKFQNYLDSLKFSVNMEESRECTELCVGLWSILQASDLKLKLERLNPCVMVSLLIIVIEFVKKTSIPLSTLDEKILKQFGTMCSSIDACQKKIITTLFQLSKQIPSLGDLISSGQLNRASVTRYIKTIVGNEKFLLSMQQTRTDEDSAQVSKLKKRKELKPGEPCIPLKFVCPTDDSESLEDINVDQYLATDTEIEAKQRIFADCS